MLERSVPRSRIATCLLLLSLWSGSQATGGALDRSGQGISALFREGTYAEIGLAFTQPRLSGEDLGTGGRVGDIADGFWLPQFAFKTQITDAVSVAVIGQQDLGADLTYPGLPTQSSYGGSFAQSTGFALAGLLRYRISPEWSVHGGLRVDWTDADIGLSGLGFGGLSGYRAQLDGELGAGYVLGGAYERPEIALRAVLTYHSSISRNYTTTETLNGATLGPDSQTRVETPQAVNFDIRTGLAPDWLAFGGVRWVDWSGLRIEPRVFNQLQGTTESSLVVLEDVTTYFAGVAHGFTPSLWGSLALIYEQPGDRMVSPLRATTGFQAIRLGTTFTRDRVEVSAFALYGRLGNARAANGDPPTARVRFEDNRAWSAGATVGYRF